MDKVTVDATADAAPEKKGIGLLDGVVFVLSCTIGSGLFFTPKEVAGAVNDPWISLLAWVIAGVLSLAGSLIYSELGTSLVSAGAESYYLLKAFGSAMSFTFCWTMVTIIGPSACACISWVLGSYVNAIFGWEGTFTVFIVAITVMASLCAINLINPSYVLMLNRFNVVCKVLAVIVVVMTGLIAFCSGAIHMPFLADQSIAKANWTGLGSAVMFALFALSGWNMLNPLIEDINNPGKDVPKIYTIGMTATMILAVLVNAAFYAGLDRSVLTDGKNTSLALLLAKAVFNDGITQDVFRIILCILICFCCLGSCNGIMMGTSKCMASNGRDGILPAAFGITSRKHQVPFISLISFTLWTSLLLVILSFDPENAVKFVVNLYTVGQWGFFCVVGISLFVLRYKFPELHRPYKVALYPVFPAFFTLTAAFVVVMTFVGELRTAAFVGVAIIFLGTGLYYASEVESCRRIYLKCVAMMPDFEPTPAKDTVQMNKVKSLAVEG